MTARRPQSTSGFARCGLALSLAVASAAGWVGCSSNADVDGGGGSPAGEAGSVEAGGPAIADAASADSAADSARRADAGDGDSPVVASPECTNYCNIIQGACAVDYPQFGTMNACLNACAFYPPGAPDDNSGIGNTLMCRTQHATSAVSFTMHCHHAGPYGYGGCGAMCEGFCQIAMGWCADSASGAPFASAAACAAECAVWVQAPARPDGVASYSSDGPTTGDTLDCREYQLVRSLGSKADRDVYCPRAATNSVPCR